MKVMLLVLIFIISSPFTTLGQYKAASVKETKKGKQIITEWTSGFVISRSGTEYFGPISLKILGSDTVLIKHKNEYNGIVKFTRDRVHEFGTGDYEEYKSKKQAEFERIKGELEQKKAKNDGIAEIETAKWVDKKDDPLLGKLKKQPGNDLKKLQSGYALFRNGLKLTGKIAQGNGEFTFVDKEGLLGTYRLGEPSKYASLNRKEFEKLAGSLDHIVQYVNDDKRVFLWGKNTTKALATGDTYEFTEVFFPDEHYSYYKNPSPANKRKGITKLATSITAAANESLERTLAEEAAKDAAKKELNQSGDVQQAAIEADKAAATFYREDSDLISTDTEGGIYYEEWVIIDNESSDVYHLYKKNAEEIMGDLLKACDSYSSLSEKKVKNLTSLDLIDEFVKFMNGCK